MQDLRLVVELADRELLDSTVDLYGFLINCGDMTPTEAAENLTALAFGMMRIVVDE